MILKFWILAAHLIWFLQVSKCEGSETQQGSSANSKNGGSKYNPSDSFQYFKEKQKKLRGCYYRSVESQTSDALDVDIGPPLLSPGDIQTGLCNVIFYQSFETYAHDGIFETSAGISDVIALKLKDPLLRVMLSVNITREIFADSMVTEVNRILYASKMISFLRNNSFDGVELAWSIRNDIFDPAASSIDIGNTRIDAINLLAEELHKQMATEASATFQDRLWVSLAPLASSLVPYLKTQVCGADRSPTVDFIHLQAFMGAEYTKLNFHHSSPYATEEDRLASTQMAYSVFADFDSWVSACGADRVALMLPAFGVAVGNCGTFLSQAPGPTKMVAYRQIAAYASIPSADFTHVPPVSPRMASTTCCFNRWIGFDDEAMIVYKTQHALAENALGATMYYLDQDYVDGKFPLTTVMNEAVLSMPADQCDASDSRSNLEVIARFPKGVWDSKDCSAEKLRLIPSKCTDALGESSTDEERLACLISTQPNTQGSIPFGMYPTSMRLDEDISQIEPLELTPVFTQCALVQMIHDGCFSFRRNTWPGGYSAYAFATEDGYMRAINQGYNAGGSLALGSNRTQVTGTLFYNYFSGTGSGNSGDKKLLGLRRSWLKGIGFLSNSCLRPDAIEAKYINPDYIQLWNQIRDINTVDGLVANEAFATLAGYGSWIPADFVYSVGVTYNYRALYNASAVNSSDTSGFETSFNIAFSNSTSGFSNGFSIKYGRPMSNNMMNAIANDTVMDRTILNGMCNFGAVLGSNSSKWEDTLGACASSMANNLDTLGLASHVSKNGFQSVYPLLYSIGVQMNPLFQEALNFYFSVCKCFTNVSPAQKVSAKYSYTCSTGDGQTITRPQTLLKCKRGNVWWWKRFTNQFTSNPKLFANS